MSAAAEQGAIAVIIGRAGSKGLPGKNAAIVAGEPMICHTIRDAQQTRCVDRLVVSTDGEAIAEAARSMGVEVMKRPAELATDTATVAATARHAVEACDSQHEAVIVLYANVPVRPDDLIDRALDCFIQTGADSVQSYCNVGKHHPYWMVTLDENSRVKPHHPNAVHRRQDLPLLFIPDGGVIVVRRSVLMMSNDAHPHAFLGDDRRGIETQPGDVIDVDSAIDLAVAEAVLESSKVRQ